MAINLNPHGKVAIALPTWNRSLFTKTCIESVKKFTNFNLVKILRVYDNDSADGTIDYLKTCGFKFEEGNFSNAWAGFNKLLSAIKTDRDVKYIGKIDNDIEFTQANWLDRIVNTFESNTKVGCIKYDTGIYNFNVNRWSIHGGLKFFRKELAQPVIGKGHKVGSANLSRSIMRKGFLSGTIGVGIIDLNRKYPDSAKEYLMKGWTARSADEKARGIDVKQRYSRR